MKKNNYHSKDFIKHFDSKLIHQGNIDEIYRICRAYHNFRLKCEENRINLQDDLLEIIDIYPELK